MFTLTTPDGFLVGFIARNKTEIKTWIRHSYGRVKLGWLNCAITKHTTWPKDIVTVFDVTKELQQVEEFLAEHRGIWYNGEQID